MKSKKAKQIEHTVLHPRQRQDFFGNEGAATTMYNAFHKGNMPGAWLISGQRGIGKATLAYRFAKFVLYNGNKKTDGLFASPTPNADLSIPANSPTFSKVSNGSHPDLLVLEAGAEDSKSNSDGILVDDARKVGSFLHLTSSETAYRIVIIDSIDNMNNNAANSILKLLEEPPSNVIFILISHAPGRLLPTIRSRCRQIKMSSLDKNHAFNILQSNIPEISLGDATNLLKLASNSPGIAYDFYTNSGIDLYETILGIISELPKLDITKIQKLGDDLSGKTNENSWRLAKVIINKIIIDITKQTALSSAYTQNSGSLKTDSERLVKIWQEINEIFEAADNIHLDRKAVLVKIFSLIKG